MAQVSMSHTQPPKCPIRKLRSGWFIQLNQRSTVSLFYSPLDSFVRHGVPRRSEARSRKEAQRAFPQRRDGKKTEDVGLHSRLAARKVEAGRWSGRGIDDQNRDVYNTKHSEQLPDIMFHKSRKMRTQVTKENENTDIVRKVWAPLGRQTIRWLEFSFEFGHTASNGAKRYKRSKQVAIDSIGFLWVQ